MTGSPTLGWSTMAQETPILLTADQYDVLVEEIVETALKNLSESPNVPMDTPTAIKPKTEGFHRPIEDALLFEGDSAFGDKSLAAFEHEMSAAFAGSIIDNSDARLPDERFETGRWDRDRHVREVAKNHLYADVKGRIYRRLQKRVAEERTDSTA